MTLAEKESVDPHRMGPLRVAIVGAGKMGRHHARAVSRLPSLAEVVAVFDPDAGSREALLALCPNAAGYAELDPAGMVDSFDVVHVCTPPPSHGAVARAALEAGCHVYVEKPFAETIEDAERTVARARQKGLRVCAGHQLLFERPTRVLSRLYRSVGPLSHVESYFTFHPTRRELSADEQLKDVLPHPTYLLLHILGKVAPGHRADLRAVHVGRDGTLHALVESGGIVGTLVVSLSGRPVASSLKLVGANGTLEADYVRGIVLRAIGPGASMIDKVLQPFRTARQLAFGSAGQLGRRFLSRNRSYPGLEEIIEAFYESIRAGSDPPLGEGHILDTVRIVERLGTELEKKEAAAESTERSSLEPPRWSASARETTRAVVITGGTGFLGSEIARVLVAADIPTRVVSRRLPARWERLAGVEYCTADLGGELSPSTFSGCETVIHCAAETRGGWDAHQRNTVEATERTLRAAAEAGVSRFIHVSSLAVIGTAERGGGITENTPLESNGREAGPYVWGKLTAEKVAASLGAELGLEVAIVRPGPILDLRAPEPPGRLGRRIGNVLVAVGPPASRLACVDVRLAAQVLAWLATSLSPRPEVLNLLDPQLPTRRELVERIRERNPDLRVVWLPAPALKVLSVVAVGLQKALRRGRPPIRLDRAFASETYDTSEIARLVARIESPRPSEVGSAALVGRLPDPK